MKFLFIAPRYHTNLHYMLMALKKYGHEVSISVLYQGQSENYSIIKPDVLGYSSLFKAINHRLNRSGGRLIKNDFEIKYSFSPAFKLLNQFRKMKPDVVVIKEIHNIYSLMAMVIARVLRKKILILLQLKKYRIKPKSYSVYLAGKIFGAKVITPIKGDPKYKNFNSNLYYLPFTIEINDFSKTYFKDDKINIICIGKFQERKGQLLLAQAVNSLKNKYNISVALIGQKDEEAYTNKLIEYIRINNLEKIFSLKFDIGHDLVMDLYKAYDLYVLPSWSEPASISILEAMSNKLAVISSDDNGTCCYVEEGYNGYIFKKKDVDDLTRKIELAVKDKDNIVKMGEASFSICRKNHSFRSSNDFIIRLTS